MENHFLFASIFEASVIATDIGKKKKPIHFEMSIGKMGNIGEENSTEANKDSQAKQNWFLSRSDGMYPSSHDGAYYYLDYCGQKPCLFMAYSAEDNRPRLCIPNILDKLNQEMNSEIFAVQHKINKDKPHEASRRFRIAMDKLCPLLDAVRVSVRACRGNSMKTLLDKEHQLRIRKNLMLIKMKLKGYRDQVTSENVQIKVNDVLSIIKRVEEISDDPQHGLPDVFFWMCIEKKKIAFARIRARDIFYSLIKEEAGRDCGKLVSVFLRKPGHQGMGESGWIIQGQLRIFMWLGLLKDILAFPDTLPEGYNPAWRDSLGVPPKVLSYTARTSFQLRCYIYMARNVIGSDNTGLSDPFLRIVINNHVITTRVVPQTLNPVWDETIILDDVIFNYSPDQVKQTVPIVVVEAFDADAFQPSKIVTAVAQGKSPSTDNDFLGRCFCQSSVFVMDDEYQYPKLEFWDIYRGQVAGGQLLASFEFIQRDPRTFKILVKNVPHIDQLHDMTDVWDGKMGPAETEAHNRYPGLLRVPDGIRPQLTPYRLEVVLWGLRELHRIFLLPVEHPTIMIEMAGRIIYSDTLKSCKNKPNFEKPLTYIDLYLSEDPRFWPPIFIQCSDKRLFKTEALVGNHVIDNPIKYLKPMGHICDDDTLTVISGQTFPTPSTYRRPPPSLQRAATPSNVIGQTPSLQGSPTIQAPSPIPSKRNITPTSTPRLKRSNLAVSVDGSPMKLTTPNTSVVMIELDSVKKDSFRSGKSFNRSNQHSMSPLPDVVGKQDLPPPPPELDKISKTGPKSGISRGKPVSEAQMSPGEAVQITKRPKPPRDIQDELDWWSRFYATLADMEAENLRNEAAFKASNKDDLQDIELDIFSNEDDDEEAILEIPEEQIKKKKKKKKMKKPTRKDLKNILKRMNVMKDAKMAFQAEGNDETIEYLRYGNEDTSAWISRIKIYDRPLEDVAEFGGFVENFKTFPLLKGIQKEEELPTSRLTGKFKGNFLLYPITEEEFNNDVSPESLELCQLVSNNEPIDVIVHVYVIRAFKLNPADPNGLADPYLVIKLGKEVCSYRDEYTPKTLNPTFGTMLELCVTFPQNCLLTVQVWDMDRVTTDDLMGETHIDLENRLFSKHRATCGLPLSYELGGYEKWRDKKPPSEILKELATKHGIAEPEYEPIFNRATFSGRQIYTCADLEDANITKKSKEPLALEILKQWSTFDFGYPLVPEHIETRPLFLEDKPDLVQGQIQMWVDIFPKSVVPASKTPQPNYLVNITPRTPAGYELRVIVHNTADVILNDVSLFSKEKSSDIQLKGWMLGADIDLQETDIHYKSLDGSGMFNWRFIFPFKFLRAEDCVEYQVKDTLLAIDKKTERGPCVFYCQIWDADLISADDFLGTLNFRLSRIPRCAKSSKSCGLFQLEDPTVPKFSLFKNKKVKGWWPLVGNDDKPDQNICTGKVELELELLTETEAEQNPVGLGREPPCALAMPNRPETSFLKFMDPLNALKYLLCNKFKYLLIKLLIIGAFLALFIYFIYNVPGYLAKKMVGA